MSSSSCLAARRNLDFAGEKCVGVEVLKEVECCSHVGQYVAFFFDPTSRRQVLVDVLEVESDVVGVGSDDQVDQRREEFFGAGHSVFVEAW